MIKKITTASLFALLPFITNASSGFSVFSGILNKLIPIIIPVTFAFFIYFMIKKFREKDAEKRKKYRKKSIKFLIGLGAVMVIWMIIGVIQSTFGIGSGGGNVNDYIPTVNNYTPNYTQNGDITDTRDYSKITYSATIKSKEVQEDVDEINQLIIHHDGRIDTYKSSKETGYINFVLPKDNLDVFRDSIKDDRLEKLINESISAVNLLSQKQDLENDFNENITNLVDQTTQQEKLIAEMQEVLQNYDKEINRITHDINIFQNSIDKFDDEDIIDSFNESMQGLIAEKSVLQNKKNIEKKRYEKLLQNASNDIENTNDEFTQIAKQEDKLINNVETVKGSISLVKINNIGIAREYLGIPKKDSRSRNNNSKPFIISLIVIAGAIYFGLKK